MKSLYFYQKKKPLGETRGEALSADSTAEGLSDGRGRMGVVDGQRAARRTDRGHCCGASTCQPQTALHALR